MCAQSGAYGPDFREAETPRTYKRKTRLEEAGLHSPVSRKQSCLATESFPEIAIFRKPRFLPRAKCAQSKAIPGGLRCTPEAPCLPLFLLPLTPIVR